MSDEPTLIRKESIVLSKFLRFLREASFLGIIFVSIVPETSRKFIFIPLIITWFLFSLLSNLKAFEKTFIIPDIKSYSIYFWILIYLFFYFIGYMKGENLTNYLTSNMRFGFSLLFFNYYIKTNENDTIKKLTIASIIFTVLVSLKTLNVLAINPIASRVLATGREELIQNLGVNTFMLGGYGFIYGLIFICIAIFGCLRFGTIKKNKIIYIISLILFMLTIFSSAYTIAIIILIISLLLISLLLLTLRINNIKFFMTLSILLMLAFIILLNMQNIFFYLSEIIPNAILSERFRDVAFFLKYGSAEGTVDLGARLEYYTISIKSFLESPLIGIGGYYGYESSIYGIGGHSAFWDELARYGILGSGYLFIALISNAIYVYRWFKDKRQRFIYFCGMLAFFTLGWINTLLFAPIAMIVFFVFPGIIHSLNTNKLND